MTNTYTHNLTGSPWRTGANERVGATVDSSTESDSFSEIMQKLLLDINQGLAAVQGSDPRT